MLTFFSILPSYLNHKSTITSYTYHKSTSLKLCLSTPANMHIHT